MKNLIFLVIALIAAITTSCSKDETEDFTKPENLSGTTWKCSYGIDWAEDLEYALLIFTSTTTVEAWSKWADNARQKDWTGSYTISNAEISISYGDESLTGIIDGKKMKITIVDETYIFSKQ